MRESTPISDNDGLSDFDLDFDLDFEMPNIDFEMPDVCNVAKDKQPSEAKTAAALRHPVRKETA